METIGGAEARSIIIESFGFLGEGNSFLSKILVCDREYLLLNKQFVNSRFMNHTSMHPTLYQRDVFDCDDYCLMAKAVSSADAVVQGFDYPYALGFIVTDIHATSFFINDDFDIQLVDFWKAKFTGRDDDITLFLRDDLGEWLYPGSLRLIYM